MILDRASDYKMVSIMRMQRSRVLLENPYDINNTTLSQIDEEQHYRWTAAMPKFSNHDDNSSSHDEEVRVPGTDSQVEDNKKTDAGDQMAFEDDTVEIKPQMDTRKMRERMMQRLAYSNILETKRERPKSYQTMIIWDWDDTLMASSFLSPY